MSARGRSIRIRSGSRTIVSIDNFAFADNDITFLFGESGIGKSTICKAIYGLLDPDELTVGIDGRPYAEHLSSAWTGAIRKSSFFVFQEPSSHLNSLMKIREQLTEGSLSNTEYDHDILRMLYRTGDDKELGRIVDIYPKPYRPSGGEKQRLLLAMAFKKISQLIKSADQQTPTYFVFDEPTGSLDDSYRNLFLKLLFEAYTQRPFTILIITHDYSIISEIYRTHRQQVDRVHFKELARNGDGTVSLLEFSAQEYFTWLQTARVSDQAMSVGEPVLEMDPEFTIFGRRLSIFGDPARTAQRPLVIRKGEMVYVKAPSGVGKTTLAKIVLGLYRASAVSMRLCGLAITERSAPGLWPSRIWGRKAGMVFQHADEALDLQATVKETFAGLPGKARLAGDDLVGRLRGLFAGELNDSFLNKKVAYLSGGQKQRLNVLRTLVLDTNLIILDEPLNGLDFKSITKVLALLEEKRRHGSALLMISHNEEIFDTIVGPDHTYYLSGITPQR